MSPLESRRVTLFGIPLEGLKRCPATKRLYKAGKNPLEHTRGDWNIGKASVTSISVGEDGESLVFGLEVLDVPIALIEGPRYRAQTHYEERTVPKEKIIEDKKVFVRTTHPLVRTEIRYVPR